MRAISLNDALADYVSLSNKNNKNATPKGHTRQLNT